MKMWPLCGVIVQILILALAVSPAAPGQSSILGSISGTVTDHTGAAIPHAAVEVVNVDTGAKRTTRTQGNGYYIVPNVLPGKYSLNISAPYFKTYVQEGFRLLVNEPQTINVEMQVGSESLEVTVSSQPTPLNSVNATVSTTVQNAEVNDLPLDGRQFTQLLELSPGVVMEQGAQQSSFTISLGKGGLSPSINGMRPQSNTFSLDGVDNNSRYTNTYAASPPPDAIQEFKVDNVANDPGSAMASGANISVTTKSGTKNFHGTLWEYLRNNVLSANGWRNNHYGFAQLPYKQNQYGLVFGGPVMIPKLMNGRKSKTFFFGYWEGFKSLRGNTYTANLPDDTIRSGDLSSLLGAVTGTDGNGNAVRVREIYDIESTVACSKCAARYSRTPFQYNSRLNVIPPGRIDPIATALMKQFLPEPNQTTAPNYVRSDNLKTSSNQYGVRLDHDFSERRSIFARYSAYDASQATPQALPTVQLQQMNTGINGMIHLTNILSPSALLDMQYGYNRTGIPRYTPGLTADQAAVFGPLANDMPGGSIVPQFTYAGSAYNGITPQLYQDLGNPEYSHQIVVNYRKQAANHGLIAGITYMSWNHITGRQGNTGMAFAVTASNQPGFNTSGYAFASFLLGYPNSSTNNILQPLHTYGDIFIGYIGDTWRATRTLSVNVGLQYDLATRPVVQGDKVSAFDWTKALTNPSATDFSFAYVWASKNPVNGQPANASRSLLLSGDHNNFAPRIGIAWSVTPKTVVRTGFGVYYDYNTNLVQNSVRIVAGSWPFGTTQTSSAQNTLMPTGITLSNPFGSLNTVGTSPSQAIARTMPDPFSVAFNFGVQRLLPGNIAVDVYYLGTRGRDLLTTGLQNIAPAGTAAIAPRRPLPALGSINWRENTGHSTYDSFQVQMQKRYSNNISFRNSFTWARAFDIQSEANETSVEYIYNRSLSYGPSDFDQPIGNVTSLIWTLPVGHQQRWGAHLPSWANAAVGSWRASGVFSAHSGRTYSILSGQDNANTGSASVGAFVANIVGNPFPQGTKTVAKWFDPAAFAVPAFGTLGNTQRNMFRGPASYTFNITMAKDFHIYGRSILQFRTDFFNAFNHTNLSNPSSTVGSATFGEILGAASGRDIQVALKLSF